MPCVWVWVCEVINAAGGCLRDGIPVLSSLLYFSPRLRVPHAVWIPILALFLASNFVRRRPHFIFFWLHLFLLPWTLTHLLRLGLWESLFVVCLFCVKEGLFIRVLDVRDRPKWIPGDVGNFRCQPPIFRTPSSVITKFFFLIRFSVSMRVGLGILFFTRVGSLSEALW